MEHSGSACPVDDVNSFVQNSNLVNVHYFYFVSISVAGSQCLQLVLI